MTQFKRETLDEMGMLRKDLGDTGTVLQGRVPVSIGRETPTSLPSSLAKVCRLGAFWERFEVPFDGGGLGTD